MTSLGAFEFTGSTTTLPATPSGVRASAGYNFIRVSWTIPPIISAYITGYKIYNTSSGTAVLVATVDSSTGVYTAHGLTSESAYSFAVAALNSIGESSLSSNVTATTGRSPMPPGTLTIRK